MVLYPLTRPGLYWSVGLCVSLAGNGILRCIVLTVIPGMQGVAAGCLEEKCGGGTSAQYLGVLLWDRGLCRSEQLNRY